MAWTVIITTMGDSNLTTLKSKTQIPLKGKILTLNIKKTTNY